MQETANFFSGSTGFVGLAIATTDKAHQLSSTGAEAWVPCRTLGIEVVEPVGQE